MVLGWPNRPPEDTDENCSEGDENESRGDLPAGLGSFAITDIESERALAQIELTPESESEDLLCCWGAEDGNSPEIQSALLPASAFADRKAQFELDNLKPDRNYWLTVGRNLEEDVSPPALEEIYFTGTPGNTTYVFMLSLVSFEGREAVLSGHAEAIGGAAEELNEDNFITIRWPALPADDLAEIISYNIYIMPDDEPLVHRHSVSDKNEFIYTGQPAGGKIAKGEYTAWLSEADESLTLAREISDRLYFRTDPA